MLSVKNFPQIFPTNSSQIIFIKNLSKMFLTNYQGNLSEIVRREFFKIKNEQVNVLNLKIIFQKYLSKN